jgi:hypothetical protein
MSLHANTPDAQANGLQHALLPLGAALKQKEPRAKLKPRKLRGFFCRRTAAKLAGFFKVPFGLASAGDCVTQGFTAVFRED